MTKAEAMALAIGVLRAAHASNTTEAADVLDTVQQDEIDYACAECGTTEATTYVVTFTGDDRTEVCRSCDDVLRAGDDALEPLHLGELTANERGLIPCPDPECDGNVVEVDVAMRWNDLSIADGDVFAGTDGSHDFERRGDDGFICSSCLRPIRSEVLDKASIHYI